MKGQPLDIDTVLDNLSVGGLYVRIPRRMEPGARLAVGIRLSEPGAGQPAARIATRGVVLRVETTSGGGHGVAVAFERYRLF